MFDFPHESAFLQRTKLSYINLPGLLSDGKRDRTGRVSGFVSVCLGERNYLIFLRDGEPFNAACIERASRGPVAIASVLRMVSQENERGEAGQIAYLSASEAQLQVMLATLLQPALPVSRTLDATKPDQVFPALRDERFDGVLEIVHGTHLHYLRFRDGAFERGYFSRATAETTVAETMRAIFGDAHGELRLTLYAPLDELPLQASPGMIDLYRRVAASVMNSLGEPAGVEGARALMREAQGLAAVQAPLVADFELTDDGRIVGEPVATPHELMRAVAAWVSEALLMASDRYGIDPTDMLARDTHEARFALEEHGFFLNVPWAVLF